jgi:hypothetical protein
VNIINNSFTVVSGSSNSVVNLFNGVGCNVTGNTVVGEGSGGAWLYLGSSDWGGNAYAFYNNMISNNRVTGNIQGIDYYYPYNVFSYNTFSNNYFNVSRTGIEYYGGAGDRILNNTIIIHNVTGGPVYGLHYNGNVAFLNNVIVAYNNSGTVYGVALNYPYSTYVNIKDSVINVSGNGISGDLYLRGVVGSVFDLTNTTHSDGSNLVVRRGADDNGTVRVNWYVDVSVKNSTGWPVGGVDVSASDVSGKLRGSASTGADGKLGSSRFTLLQYAVNRTYVNYSIPYTFAASKPGYALSVDSFNFSGNSLMNITIEIANLGLNFVTPTPANGASTSSTSAQIKANVSNAEALSDFVWDWDGTNYSFYDDSLKLMYNFDNVSVLGENSTSAIAYDASQYGNNGTCVGMGTGCNWTTGRYGNALSFNGNDSGVDLSWSSSLDFSKSNSYTIAVWIYPLSNPSLDSTIVDIAYQTGTNTNISYYIATTARGATYGTTNGAIFGIYDGNWNVVSTGALPTLNKWTYIVGTYDGAALKIYQDGILKSSLDYNGGVPFNNLEINIGRDKYDGSYYYSWNGTLDEIRMWNRSLSADEISQQYNSNVRKYDADKWDFYSNQTNLSLGEHTYYASAADASGNTNSAGTRTLNIQSLTNIVPEFGTWALLLALGLVVAGVMSQRSRKVRK